MIFKRYQRLTEADRVVQPSVSVSTQRGVSGEGNVLH